MDFKKFGIVYLLIGIVGVLFVLTKVVFPGVTLDQLTKQQFGNGNASSSADFSSLKEGVRAEIDFGDNKKSYENISASNAYLVLVEAAKKDNLGVEIKQYDFGILVEKVGNYTNSKDRVWVYYVNGESGNVAADKKEIKNGDLVEWKYVKP